MEMPTIPPEKQIKSVESSTNGKMNVIEQTKSVDSVVENERPTLMANPPDLIADIIEAVDDPMMNPWTVRTWVLGSAISAFAATTVTINTFKPHPVTIQLVFIVVLSYVLGTAWDKLLPKKGLVGRVLNPQPFNVKEQTAICIMAGSAATSPEAMSIIAVQKVFYDIKVHPMAGLALIFSAQMLGYGVAGVLRSTLVYPTKMLYPMNIPVAALLQTLHRDKKSSSSKMKVFYIAFAVLFLWQAIPTYIMPLLGAISVFCLTNRHNLVVTNLFGGAMAMEGLGFGSISLDWSAITGMKSPLWMPLQALCNEFLGYIIALGLFMGIYYTNVFDAKRFPFLSPMLMSEMSTNAKYVPYDVKSILNSQNEVDPQLVDKIGLPRFSAVHTTRLVTLNVAIAAAISHVLLWHYNDVKSAWGFASMSNLKQLAQFRDWNWKFWQRKGKRLTSEQAAAIDPHYALMQSYQDIPHWWFGAVWVISVAVGLLSISVPRTTLPWWGFTVAIMTSHVCVVFFVALEAMFGFKLMAQPFFQMLGAYLIPGKPIANMYFATFGFNTLMQSSSMLRDLKLGQYLHLAPRCLFVMQISGTAIGCAISYAVMETITDTKREILLSIQGDNIWSGQLLQMQNSSAISWGGLAKYMFSIGRRYQWVPLGFFVGVVAPLPAWIGHKYFPRLRLDYLNIPIMCATIDVIGLGMNSQWLMYYALGFLSQFYIRRYRQDWFVKYNYILSAGLDGGTAVINFILTFTVLGASGLNTPFPPYFGNNFHNGNYDYCMKDPGLGMPGK